MIVAEEPQKLVRDTARDFASRRLRVIGQEMEESGKMPPSLFTELGRLGLLGLPIPEEYGGLGAGFLASAIAMEELAKVSGAATLSYGAHSFLCAYNFYSHANEDLRRKYLPGLISGETIGAFALTEPEAGSDAASLKTKAEIGRAHV